MGHQGRGWGNQCRGWVIKVGVRSDQRAASPGVWSKAGVMRGSDQVNGVATCSGGGSSK